MKVKMTQISKREQRCGPRSPGEALWAGGWAQQAARWQNFHSDKSTAENLKRCEQQKETKPEGSDV